MPDQMETQPRRSTRIADRRARNLANQEQTSKTNELEGQQRRNQQNAENNGQRLDSEKEQIQTPRIEEDQTYDSSEDSSDLIRRNDGNDINFDLCSQNVIPNSNNEQNSDYSEKNSMSNRHVYNFHDQPRFEKNSHKMFSPKSDLRQQGISHNFRPNKPHDYEFRFGEKSQYMSNRGASMYDEVDSYGVEHAAQVRPQQYRQPEGNIRNHRSS